MKKLFFVLIAVSLITFNAFSQTPKSQRVILCEEFTQASCGPCAADNPAYNALLKANPGKVVSIKYQTSWPGVDPMNAQTASQVATRVTYYGVTGVPNTVEDGNIYNGIPTSFTQALIDGEYAVASPFTITMSHYLSPNYDSVYVKCYITCTTATTFTGPLQGYVVMTEDTISFATAPGSNGEKVFYDIMRKMYPSDAGATLPLTWAVGDVDSILVAAPIPSYIYDLRKMSFVAFVQDNSNKNVKQAVYEAPIPISSNSSITAVASVPAMQCNANPFTPSVTLKNTSATDTLFTTTIVYSIDNGAGQTQVWNGVLLPGATTSVTLAAITPTTGAHTLSVYTTPYLGSMNSTTVKYVIESNFVAAPLVEGFEETTFPPSNWVLDNVGGSNWVQGPASAFGTGSSSAAYAFYSIPAGNIGYLYSLPMDFTGLSVLKMSFVVAYAQYQTENDQLDVQVSTNCGTTWTSLYTKSGATLATAAATTSSFVPTATQWRTELVDFASVAGQANVLVRFKATSAYGNNLFIDNINLATDAGISEIDLNNNIVVSPNPFNASSKLTFSLSESNDVNLKIMNVLGQQVSETNQGRLASGIHTIVLNGENLSSGIYFVNLTIGNKTITKKVSVNH